MKNKEAKINCPTFQKQEPVIQSITAKINNTKDVLKKAEFAEKLEKEVNVLLSCPNYKEKDKDCSNCHFIASIRKKTTDLIIKTKKLA
jgi:ABC-type hemin transport system substrate-binding protein